MVASSLPFWLHQPSRTMSNFATGLAVEAGADQPDPRPSWRERPGTVARAGGLFVELCGADAMIRHADAWAGLAARALEPNIFLEPGFALAAARHFPAAWRPVFLLVWAADIDGRPVLLGLCPVQLPRLAFAARVASAWTHDQATLSAPLLDRERATDALAALLAGLDQIGPGLQGLILRGLEVDGPLWRLLTEVGPDKLNVLERRSRAVLRRKDLVHGAAASAGNASKRAKELRRQRRRLADHGSLALSVATAPAAVRDATEQFLFLESRGWKGRRGTALLHTSTLASFTRTMTRVLARLGQCRIYSLDLDGRPVAMGIVLSSGTRAYFWKTAYDQAHGRHSPGKQLAVALTGELLADPGIALTDSCAVPDHPMIDRLWDARMTVADVLIGAPHASARSVGRIAAALRYGRACRAWIKAGVVGVRRRLARR